MPAKAPNPAAQSDTFRPALSAPTHSAPGRERWASTQLRFAFELCGSLIGALLLGF